jgi:hypothetical protein
MDDLLAKKPETRRVEVPLDPDLAERYSTAKVRLDQAKRLSDASPKDGDRAADLEAAQEECDALRAELEPCMAKFVLRSVSPVEFEALKGKNRPTEKQRTDYRKSGVEAPEWNPDTFQPALVAAACVEIVTPNGTQDGLAEDDALCRLVRLLQLHQGGLGKRLEDGGQLGAELAYCVPLGIPHSILLGRPQPGPGEPLWTMDDRAKALGWRADQAEHCGSCGQRRSDWLDAQGKELRDPPFEVVESLCSGCQALGYHREESAEERDKDAPPRHGIHYGFKRVSED